MASVLQFPDTRRTDVAGERLVALVVDLLLLIREKLGQHVAEAAMAMLLVEIAALLRHVAGKAALVKALDAVCNANQV